MGHSHGSRSTGSSTIDDATRPIAEDSQAGLKEWDLIDEGGGLGRYNILDHIGRGGMGHVYRAHDPELDRDVALKLLRIDRLLEALDTKAHARLRREAQAMAQVNHPNVMPIYDVIEADGRLVIAMEYVDGQTLKQWLERDRSWPELQRVFVDAGRGLAAAHARGLVHRDFKPSNVLVGRDGRVRVMDFGLAHPTTSNASEGQDSTPELVLSGEAHLTQTGLLMGTPAYMAPEQHQGRPTDPRSDQFSFCVALYEAIAGERPFPGTDTLELSRSKRAGNVRDGALRGRAPTAVVRAVMRGLQTDPDRRFASMSDLLRHLTPSTRPATSRTWMAGGVVMTLAGGVYFGTAGSRDACVSSDDRLGPVWNEDRAKELVTALSAAETEVESHTIDSRIDAYAAAWADEHSQLCAARAAGEVDDEAFELRVDCLDSSLNQLDALVDTILDGDQRVLMSADRLTVALPAPDRCHEAEFLANRAAPPNREIAARVSKLRTKILKAKTLQDAGVIDEARDMTVAAVTDARELEYPPVLVEALLQLGSIGQRTGEFSAAERSYSEAYWIAKDQRIDRGAMAASTELAFIVGARLVRPDDGLEWARHARAALDRVGDEPLWERQLERAMAGIYFRQRNFEMAVEHTRTSLQIAIDVYGEEHDQVAESLTNLGVYLQGTGAIEEAIESIESAVAMWERTRGPDFPNIAVALNNLCSLNMELGHHEEAIALGEDALKRWESVAGRLHPRTANIHGNLGLAYRNRGDLEEAAKHFRESLDIYAETVGPEHPNSIGMWVNLGAVVQQQGDPAEAEQHVRRALELAQSVHGEDHEETKMAREALERLKRGEPASG